MTADRGGATVAVVGTGGLARAVCHSLAAVCGAAVHVIIIGRSHDKARQLCYVANTRAACSGHRQVTFEPLTGGIEAAAGRAIDGVLVCASSQSPWERSTAPSAWTALLERAGFGLTLPFQAELALHVGRTLARRHPRPWLINACLPDAVNPLLAALGVPVLCGIGNIALLAASVQAALELPDQGRLRMLAHHVHLHAPAGGTEEALVWCDQRPVADVGALLADQRATARAELNHVTGHTAALLLTGMLTGTEIEAHLPGPLGLPGGYPISLRGTDLRLRLPAGVSQRDAVAFNQRAAAADGVVVDGDRVMFGPAASAELEHLAHRLTDGFPVTALSTATAELHELRARMRRQPAEKGDTSLMPNSATTVPPAPVLTDGPTASANLLVDFPELFARAIERVIERSVQACEPVIDDPAAFSPGFALPESDDDIRTFFAAATARWQPLGSYRGHRLTLLDLTANPGTGTTKTFASLLIVARAVEHVRRTGERIMIFSPTSANKGVALRDAVLRAIEAGLVEPEQLRVVVLAPRSCQLKLRASRLSIDGHLRALNPLLLYGGTQPEDVKPIGRQFVDRYAAVLRRERDTAVWFSLELRNYLVADTARAFFEQQVDPTDAAGARPRLHAHAVSSAFGLLGYHEGRAVLEELGLANRDTRPASLLVQHLGTPDMVINLRHGDFDPGHRPDYLPDPVTGLHRQSTDARFPHVTYDPYEVLDPTFYTRRPATSPAMNDLIGTFGGDGIVVSLAECVDRYPALRAMLAGTGCPLPADLRTLREWSLAMALTGVCNAIDRGLVEDGRDIVVHGSGSYTAADYEPLEPSAMTPVSTVEDMAAAVLGQG
jgi:Family of unknown function (DUF6002)